jgi:hypothetical protein
MAELPVAAAAPARRVAAREDPMISAMFGLMDDHVPQNNHNNNHSNAEAEGAQGARRRQGEVDMEFDFGPQPHPHLHAVDQGDANDEDVQYFHRRDQHQLQLHQHQLHHPQQPHEGRAEYRRRERRIRHDFMRRRRGREEEEDEEEREGHGIGIRILFDRRGPAERERDRERGIHFPGERRDDANVNANARHRVVVLEMGLPDPGPVFPFESEYRNKRRRAIDNVRNREFHLELTGKAWSAGDPESTRAQQIELLAALVTNKNLQSVQLGYDFFSNLSDEQDQARVFHRIASLPALSRLSVKGSAVAPGIIHTPLLLSALTTTQNRLEALTVWNIVLSNESELDQLVELLKPPCGRSLARLSLKLVVSTTTSTNAASNNGNPNMNDSGPSCSKLGFLDPVLRALAPLSNDDDDEIGYYRQPPFFTLTGYQRSSMHGPPLITVAALRAYLAAGVLFHGKENRSLTLEGLGLDDDHCQAIAEHFAVHKDDGTSDRMLRNLWLRNNPAIGKEGYAALMGLLNRHHATLYTIRVDDKSWEAQFDFVMNMNTEYGRGQFLEDGVFTSKAKWVDWLEWLDMNTSAPPKDSQEESRTVNFLFYSLLENPGFLSS